MFLCLECLLCRIVASNWGDRVSAKCFIKTTGLTSWLKQIMWGLQQMILGQRTILTQKGESGHLLYTYTKTNSKFVKGLNVRAKTTKLLEKKKQVNLHDHELGNNFLHMTSKAKQVLVTQSCPTLCDPMDCSPPGSSVHGILQARILEWVSIPFSTKAKQSKSKCIYWISQN